MTSTKLYSGIYLIKGKNIQAEISNDMGYWEVDNYSDNTKGLENTDYQWMQWGTKRELIGYLTMLDESVND